jgi:hypothetical protein
LPRSNLLFDTGSFKTLLAPATPQLVACTVIGGTVTGIIPFLGLDGSDQFGLEKTVGLNAEPSGNVPGFIDIHGRSPSSWCVADSVMPTVKVQQCQYQHIRLL